MPEISIIVPVYKVEEYLDRCVTSILNQTFTDYELILVDDGSPDRCPEICDRWAAKSEKIKVIHKSNGGLSSARNAGLDIAEGNYIGFVDSDDWIEPNMYMNMHNLILLKDYDIAICGFVRTVDYSEKLNADGFIESVREWDKDDLLKNILKVNQQNSNQYAWNKLYKKELWNDVRYPNGLTDEDVAGTFSVVINANKIIETNRVGYAYYVNDNSITMTSFNEKKFDFLKICDLVIDSAEKYGNEEIIEYARLFRYRADLGVLCRMMMSKEEEVIQYVEEKYELVNKIKRNFHKLLKSPIPISRKILVCGIKYNYKLTEKIIRKVVIKQ